MALVQLKFKLSFVASSVYSYMDVVKGEAIKTHLSGTRLRHTIKNTTRKAILDQFEDHVFEDHMLSWWYHQIQQERDYSGLNICINC